MDVASYGDDPLGFVLASYPWGVEGTLLEDYSEPDTWQVELLRKLGDRLKSGANDGATASAIREATKAGHGVGKSALVSWLIQWFASTRPHPQIVVTANTQTQLRTKTWRELSKWHNVLRNKHWFTWTATSFYLTEHPETWAAHAIPWSINNADAFAGTHDENVLIIFDEASGIDKAIWDTAEGAMTTPGAMWCSFGNPTRNSGAFYDCFNRFSHRWGNNTVDSRFAMMANRSQIDEWISDYGFDSDFVRVRVRGEFPVAGSSQLIRRDAIEAAMVEDIPDEAVEGQPLILGVDVARFGDDESVLYMRRGRKHSEPLAYKGVDTMGLADIVSEAILEHSPDAVFVDGGGVGGGVVDRLRQLGHMVDEVNFGLTSFHLLDPDKYANKRAECWDLMRKHIEDGCDIPNDPDLLEQLIAQEYMFDSKNKMLLVAKKDMKKHGLPSPDRADALALTFARPVVPSSRRKRKGKRKGTRSSWRTI